MRDILFRGKRVDDGKWVYGYYVVLKGTKNTYHYIFTGELTFSLSYEEHSVIPETVGQYTGLTDKNGTKIFEGDIVKIPDDYEQYGFNAGQIYAVYFAFGGFRLKPKLNKKARGYWLEDDGVVEVIGNIYDNKELLEGGQ